MMAVIEGLLFYGDYLVARNCGMCFAMILGWEKFGLVEKRAIKDSKWCRIVMEEFVMALAAPGLTSRCFTNQHKPAAYMAVTLLKLDRVPEWMKSLFDSSCISGIVNNLSASNVTAEIVMFFRELMMRNYLNDEHIATLHHLFQVSIVCVFDIHICGSVNLKCHICPLNFFFIFFFIDIRLYFYFSDATNFLNELDTSTFLIQPISSK